MDLDIYDDLDHFADSVKIEKLEKENRILKNKVTELEKELLKQTEQFEQTQKLNNNLKINISKLFKTAQAELNYKDKYIEELRCRNDHYAFKRQNYLPQINTSYYSSEYSNNERHIANNSQEFRANFDLDSTENKASNDSKRNNSYFQNNSHIQNNSYIQNNPNTRLVKKGENLHDGIIEKHDNFKTIEHRPNEEILILSKNTEHHTKEEDYKIHSNNRNINIKINYNYSKSKDDNWSKYERENKKSDVFLTKNYKESNKYKFERNNYPSTGKSSEKENYTNSRSRSTSADRKRDRYSRRRRSQSRSTEKSKYNSEMVNENYSSNKSKSHHQSRSKSPEPKRRKVTNKSKTEFQRGKLKEKKDKLQSNVDVKADFKISCKDVNILLSKESVLSKADININSDQVNITETTNSQLCNSENNSMINLKDSNITFGNGNNSNPKNKLGCSLPENSLKCNLPISDDINFYKNIAQVFPKTEKSNLNIKNEDCIDHYANTSGINCNISSKEKTENNANSSNPVDFSNKVDDNIKQELIDCVFDSDKLVNIEAEIIDEICDQIVTTENNDSEIQIKLNDSIYSKTVISPYKIRFNLRRSKKT